MRPPLLCDVVGSSNVVGCSRDKFLLGDIAELLLIESFLEMV